MHTYFLAPFCRSLLVIGFVISLLGCKTGGSGTKGQSKVPLGWQELAQANYLPTDAPHLGWSFDLEVPRSYKRGLPTAIRGKSELVKLIWLHDLEKPKVYNNGILGLKNGVQFFVGLKRDIPDYDRLYWVMVKLLSEKYGCFMMAHFKVPKLRDGLGIKCRDSRLVVFSRRNGMETLEFAVKQFDKTGKELVVKERKVVILSKEVQSKQLWSDVFKVSLPRRLVSSRAISAH